MEIIDPRTAFATPDRFPDVPLHAEWPEDVLKRGRSTATRRSPRVTHDPKIDDFALKAALDAGCFYVGALGSRKTHAKRVERLLALGASADQIARIHAPIGLDIGASSPAEIAVAVLAQIINALRTRGAGRRKKAKRREIRAGRDRRGGRRDARACDHCRRQAVPQGARADRRRCRRAEGGRRHARSSRPCSTPTISTRTTPRRASPQSMRLRGVEAKPAATGRVNLHARPAGVFTVDRR